MEVQHALGDDQRRWTAVLERLPDPALIIDTAGRILAANTPLRERLASLGPLVGQRCFAVLHRRHRRCDPRRVACPLAERAEEPEAGRVHAHQVGRGWRWERVESRPLADASGVFVGCLTTLRPLGPGETGGRPEAPPPWLAPERHDAPRGGRG